MALPTISANSTASRGSSSASGTKTGVLSGSGGVGRALCVDGRRRYLRSPEAGYGGGGPPCMALVCRSRRRSVAVAVARRRARIGPAHHLAMRIDCSLVGPASRAGPGIARDLEIRFVLALGPTIPAAARSRWLAGPTSQRSNSRLRIGPNHARLFRPCLYPVHDAVTVGCDKLAGVLFPARTMVRPVPAHHNAVGPAFPVVRSILWWPFRAVHVFSQSNGSGGELVTPYGPLITPYFATTR